MSTFPKLGVSDIGKSTELATALCDLELDLLMLIATACALLASVLSVASSSGLSCCVSWQSTYSSGTWGPYPYDIHIFVVRVSSCHFGD